MKTVTKELEVFRNEAAPGWTCVLSEETQVGFPFDVPKHGWTLYGCGRAWNLVVYFNDVEVADDSFHGALDGLERAKEDARLYAAGLLPVRLREHFVLTREGIVSKTLFGK